MRWSRLDWVLVFAAIFTCFCAGAISAQGNLTEEGNPSIPDITLGWDANEEPDLAGYYIHWKTGKKGGEPYDGDISGVSPSPIRLTLPMLESGTTVESGVTREQWRILDLPNNTPGEFYYAVVTAFDSEEYWDSLAGVTKYGRESHYSNEVKWQVVGNRAVVVWPPEVLNLGSQDRRIK